MPKTETVMVGNDWVELTDHDTESASVQNASNYILLLQATPSAVPSVDGGSITMLPNSGIINELLADLWPGTIGAARLFARCPDSDRCQVFISHG